MQPFCETLASGELGEKTRRVTRPKASIKLQATRLFGPSLVAICRHISKSNTGRLSINQLILLMGFDELPQEVLDVIVDFAVSETNYLRDDTTMKACAITSRSLTSRAQRNIFKQVKLIAVKDFSIFESKLASSPRLGAYTAILLVSLGDRRWLQPDVTPSTQRKMGTLAIIFQACPNVDTLRVLVDESISPLHMASLGSTRNLRALRHIHLIGAFGGAGGLAYSVFEAFCSLARRLDVLELSSMELTFDESAPRALVLPDIRRLDMVLVADEQSFNRLTDMLKGCLEELVIHLSKDRAPNQAVQLFSTLGHRLRHLSITGLTDGKHYL